MNELWKAVKMWMVLWIACVAVMATVSCGVRVDADRQEEAVETEAGYCYRGDCSWN